MLTSHIFIAFAFHEDLGRLLQPQSNADSRSAGNTEGSYRQTVGIYLVWGTLLFTLLIVVVIWCIVSLQRVGYCTTRRQIDAALDDAQHVQGLRPDPHSTLAQRKLAVLQLFAATEVTMKVTESDIHESTEDQSNEDIELGVPGGTLTVSSRRAVDTSSKNASTTTEGLVFFSLPPPDPAPNCCAICLESYRPGEVVAWSCSCKHIFHQDCIGHYLAKKMIGGETPCPCCRQKFCDLPQTLVV